MTDKTYTGVAATLEKAVALAHGKIPPSPGKDYAISRVTGWGMQFGGFAETTRFWAEVVEDKTSPFKTDG